MQYWYGSAWPKGAPVCGVVLQMIYCGNRWGAGRAVGGAAAACTAQIGVAAAVVQHRAPALDAGV
jgi:hypothetical protein